MRVCVIIVNLLYIVPGLTTSSNQGQITNESSMTTSNSTAVVVLAVVLGLVVLTVIVVFGVVIVYVKKRLVNLYLVGLR